MKTLPRALMMFDTSVYIRNIRSGTYPSLEQDESLFLRTILTAVVAAELYAGTRGADDKKDLDTICLRHKAVGTLSCPTRESWLLMGVWPLATFALTEPFDLLTISGMASSRWRRPGTRPHWQARTFVTLSAGRNFFGPPGLGSKYSTFEAAP